MSLPLHTPAAIPTTLIIDFYDSYTRNLLSLFSRLGALCEAGKDGQSIWQAEDWSSRVVVVNVDSLTWDQFIEEILPHIDCIVLGPGPGSPHKTADFSWPTRLICEFGDTLPILGVCLGHQGLATAFGGTVGKAPAPRHGQVSQVRHDGSELFDGVPEVFGAVQFNSLTVDSKLPDELEATAWATSQGYENVMGLRHRTKPLSGVQFHPESIASTYGVRLLSNFLTHARSHHLTYNPSRTSTPSLPAHIRLLSTSLPPKVYMNGIPVSQSDWKYELRSIDLGTGGGRSTQDVFENFVKGGNELGEIWLDSARPTVSPQFSHLFNPTFTWSFSRLNNTLLTRNSSSSHLPATASTSLSSSTAFLGTLSIGQANLKRLTQIPPNLPSVPLGFVGYLSYEMKEVTLLHCASPREEDDVLSEFAFAATILSFEHATGNWRASGLVRINSAEPDQIESLTSTRFGIDEAEWESYSTSVKSFFDSPNSKSKIPTPTPIAFSSLVSDLTPTEYISAIDSARASIVAGDAYELCLTTQFRTTITPSLAVDPYPLYASLRQTNPAPYSAYFRLPQSNIALLSSSPERFMSIDKSGRVEMKPIKGTVRRSSDPVEDERRRKALEADEKERAENLMIVDLCRNDLLGFCAVESVEVPRLMVVESYQTVHQLVTSITGQLAAEVTPFEAIAGAFPPGSMTGAPKLRSVQILEQLERNVPRGVYAGIFGYVSIDGTTDFSVVIRTMVIRGNQMQLGGGGAITHLSQPKQEWEEALLKIEAVIRK